MHWTTAKLIKLDQAEKYLTHPWSEHLRFEFGNLVRDLRHEIPPYLLATYDQLKLENKDPVVGVVHEKCDGCTASLSLVSLKRLGKEHEASNCEQCGRFIYLAVGHDLTPSDRSHLP